MYSFFYRPFLLSPLLLSVDASPSFVLLYTFPYCISVARLIGFRSLLTQFLPHAHSYSFSDGEGFLLVYSIAARSTFERIKRFRDQITRVKDTENVPLMLVGNKCDKLTEREVSRDEGSQMAKLLRCEFTETSAKTCVNVERSFYNVVRMIRNAREGGVPRSGYKPNKKKSKCTIL